MLASCALVSFFPPFLPPARLLRHFLVHCAPLAGCGAVCRTSPSLSGFESPGSRVVSALSRGRGNAHGSQRVQRRKRSDLVSVQPRRFRVSVCVCVCASVWIRAAVVVVHNVYIIPVSLTEPAVREQLLNVVQARFGSLLDCFPLPQKFVWSRSRFPFTFVVFTPPPFPPSLLLLVLKWTDLAWRCVPRGLLSLATGCSFFFVCSVVLLLVTQASVSRSLFVSPFCSRSSTARTENAATNTNSRRAERTSFLPFRFPLLLPPPPHPPHSVSFAAFAFSFPLSRTPNRRHRRRSRPPSKLVYVA